MTDRLRESIIKITEEIVDMGMDRDQVTVNGRKLTIEEVEYFSGTKFLLIESSWPGPPIAMNYDSHWAQIGHWEGPGRDEIAWFAENLTEILREFTKLWDERAKKFLKIEERFQTLRDHFQVINGTP
ncbi:MAG: hypothetical protein ACE5OZ_18370 [Candidatus Heimdallarchaeota archaeon]